MAKYTSIIDNKISLYEFIEENRNDENILEEQSLPDEKESMQFWYKKNEDLEEINFAPGMINGVCGDYKKDTKEIIEKIFENIKLIDSLDENDEEGPSKADEHIGNIYELCIENQTLSFIDDFSDALLERHEEINSKILYNVVMNFLFNAAHREPLKFAIAVLGLLTLDDDHIMPVCLVGLSAEFAKVVALFLLRQDRNDLLLELAKKHDGWGRIEYIERFEPSTDEEKFWLITQGFRNDVMDNYLAYECIVKADLKNILENTPILHGELYEGVRDLIKALVQFSSPRETIDDYEHKEFLLLRFLDDSRKNATSLEDLSCIVDIYDYIEYEQTNEETIWDKDTIENILFDCRFIFTDESFHWRKLIKENAFDYIASSLAPRFDVDIFDDLLEEAKKDLSEASFYTLGKVANKEQFEELIKFAEKNLPLYKISSGVANELGLKKEFHFHGELNFLLQDLKKYPKKEIGSTLILAALNSPVTNNRNMAMNLLEVVEYEINVYIYDQIKRNIQNDPNENLVKKYKEFLKLKGKEDAHIMKSLKGIFTQENRYI